MSPSVSALRFSSALGWLSKGRYDWSYRWPSVADHPEHVSTNWQEIRAQTIASLIVVSVIAVIGGIAYIAYTVPTKLDHVITNQEELHTRIKTLENQNQLQEVRIIKLESSR